MVEEQQRGRFRNLSGRVVKEAGEEAFWTARRWRGRERTVWTDGSKLIDGKVGAAAVWWKEARVEP